MNIEKNIKRLKNVNENYFIQNLIAQADARYILFNTFENPENFPKYTINDDKLNILALHYLDIGCTFSENNDIDNSIESMEKGASILEYIHGSESNKTEFSNYYSLISALSYYVSFQYSKSFILIKKTQSDTIISRIISLFLQRKFNELNNEVDKLVFNESYQDRYIYDNDNETDGSNKIYDIIIAKSLYGFVKYLQTGDKDILSIAKQHLVLIKEISELKSEPSVWWVVRLLLLISNGFEEASLWNILGKYFDSESTILKKYIKSLVYLEPRGIYELFLTQRKSLAKVLNTENNGCVVTIPTSSGKTRIAEIAILDSFIKHPENKILYIAPFRSLAFEIENSLEKILGNIGIILSHLYGGSLFNSLDEKIIDESNLIIATPEKAKAIFRGNREICNQLKLIIIDEGHLLGENKRLIVNEIFYEELRFFIEDNGGKFLLLSAVLPNPEDLSLWLTKSEENIYKDNWRPSDERLGILEWTGRQVNLNWINKDKERLSFNKNFILSKEKPLIGKQRKVKYFPGDKNEAVASATYKLKNFGSALIFVGAKKSVFTMANAYLKCLGNNPEDYKWSNKIYWNMYELACVETYGNDNEWLSYAKKGILCHHGNLHIDVRLPLERLMRNEKPLVIIATSTLGQGVNLGVSTVVFSTIYQAGELISARDFWNIAGRAGRAFIDHEAKILVAIDKSTLKAKQKSSWTQEKIINFFNKEKIDIASSGILALVKKLKTISENNNIDFDFLLELISENRITELGDNAKSIDDTFDWIDDTLLALLDLNNETDQKVYYDSIETFFRNSLAYIQIKENNHFTKDNFIDFIKARTKGIVKKIGGDRNKWKSIIKSGIPLNSDLFLEEKLPEIIYLLKDFSEIEKSIDVKIDISKKIVTIISKIPLLEDYSNELGSNDFDEIITNWMKAEAFSILIKLQLAENLITKVFSYNLPWILNGISKKLKNIELEDESKFIEEISMLIEIGLPNLKTVKIYQAGIRSRVYANELAKLFEDELWDKSIKDYKKDLSSNRDFYKAFSSEKCGEWIDFLFNTNNSRLLNIDSIPNFKFDNACKKTSTLIAKKINGEQHLVSPDFSFIQNISNSKINFSSINEKEGVFFKYDDNDNLWKMIVENPYLKIVNP